MSNSKRQCKNCNAELPSWAHGNRRYCSRLCWDHRREWDRAHIETHGMTYSAQASEDRRQLARGGLV